MVWFFFCSWLLIGQNESSYTITKYSISDGMPNVTMNVIGQDAQGFLWLSDPLTRFDGHTFKVYPEKVNDTWTNISVVSMSDDGKGNLLFAGRQGVYRYDPILDQIIKIPSRPINSSDRRIFYSDDHNFWDMSRQHLYRIDLPTYDTTNIDIKSQVRVDAFAVEDGIPFIWTTSGTNDVERFDLRDYTAKIYCPKGLIDPHHAYPVFDDKGQFWIYSDEGFWKYSEAKDEFEPIVSMSEMCDNLNINTQYDLIMIGEQGLYVYRQQNRTVYKYNFSDQEVSSVRLPFNYQHEYRTKNYDVALELKDESLMMGSSNMGLMLVHFESGTFQSIDANPQLVQSLVSNHAKPEWVIDQKTAFVSGIGQGLIKQELETKPFQHVRMPTSIKKNSYDQNIRSIVPYKNGMLVGSITDIQYYNTTTQDFSTFSVPGLESINKYWGATDIAFDQYLNPLVMFWVTGEEAPIYYHDQINDRVLNLTDDLYKTSFSASSALHHDSKDRFWVGAQSGVYVIHDSTLIKNEKLVEGKNLKWYSFESWQPQNTDVHKTTAFDEDADGNLWVGTNNGLFKINPENDSIYCYKPNQNQPASLTHTDIRSVRVDQDGAIWVGSAGGGLHLYDAKNDQFINYSISEGLPDNTIYTIEVDDQNTLWLGSNKGLIHFNPYTQESFQYLPIDGIQSYEFNFNASCRLPNGYLAFGGINGFNIFHPDSILKSSNEYPLVFTEFKVNSISHSSQEDRIVLNHNQNFLDLELSLLDHYKHDQIKYAYRLKGLENDWTFTEGEAKAHYPGLRPGMYTFEAKAAAHRSKWSDVILSKTIVIKKPWWATWPFRFFLLLVLAGALYYFYLYKQRQQEHMHQLRNRISKDLHDEIGSTLSSISLFGTVAQKMISTDQNKASQMLEKINDSTTSVMESINDIVWAIDSKNDKLDSLVKRMRAFASELSDASETSISVSVEDDIKEITLNMVQRRNIYYLYKEAMNNAIKYAQADLIEVVLMKEGQKLKLMIKDNGKGFDLNKVQKTATLSGNGLRNMKDRVDQISGHLMIDSSPGKGTTITVNWNPSIQPKY